ncbi:hypothetical protein QZH41_015748 [Actinostola sp. cb2023]|nr:hypothetical protein QZH41_015748 [Actinostola sp. cb2023]
MFPGLKSKGDRAFRHGDLLQAISYYTDALSIDPVNQEVLGCRSTVYSKLGMHNEAKKDAERLIMAVPNNPKGYFIKAVALENLGNYTESLKSFLSTYERDSRHPSQLVLNIMQVSGCICQLSEDEELNLSSQGDDDDDAQKFRALVQIGKRFCKNQDYTLCNVVLKTALTSHCSLTKASYWLESSDGDSNHHTLKEQQDFEPTSGYHGDGILGSTNTHVFSSLYLTTGYHGDTSFHGNLMESQWDEQVDRTAMVDSSTLMSALITLCLSYFSLGQFKQALMYSKQCLQLSLECESKKYELKSYVHLANIYQKLGDYLQAISYNGKLLAVGRDLVKSQTPSRDYESFWGTSEERKALWNLSAAYKSMGDIKKAFEYAKEYLELLKTINEENLTLAYSNLGELELLLGNLESALEYHKMELKFCRKSDDKVAISYAYGNIGKVYAAMGNQTLSELNHAQHLKLAQNIGDRLSELVAVRQLGDMYRLMGDYVQALQHYEKYLCQVKMKHLVALQCQVYGLIGLCYWKMNQLYRAQHNFELSLKLATEVSEKEEELNSRFCLAKVMKALRLYEKCRQYYNEVIPTLEHRLYVKQGNSIIYEDEVTDKLADSYEDLQEALVEMDYIKEALEISEHCNSRVLVNILRCKEILKDNEDSRVAPDLSPNTAEEIFKLVDSSDRLVLIYSRLKDGFISWLLSPSKGVLKFHRYKNCDHVTVEERIKSCVEDLHSNQVCNYKCDQRSLPHDVILQASDKNSKTNKSCFTCTFSKANTTPLQRLHELLLEPFREQLSDSDFNALAVVPIEMMMMVPFPSLQDAKGSFLYEKFQVTIMPCIRAFSLASTNPDESTTDNNIKVLVAGNPTIPNVNLYGAQWRPCGREDLAEQEVTSLATLLGVDPVTGCQATTERILEMLSQSSVAHLVTYGSWKKGCLAFAPNPNCHGNLPSNPNCHGNLPSNPNCHGNLPSEDAYLLTVSDLLALDLRTKLVVISSCVSCSHKFCYLKQASLSLATALLAAGARSVIFPLWSVEQATLIRFYCHLYSGLEKVCE